MGRGEEERAKASPGNAAVAPWNPSPVAQNYSVNLLRQLPLKTVHLRHLYTEIYFVLNTLKPKP